MQPQASGSGWGAPGRALQGLGKSIASLGDVFDSIGQEQIAEQDFQDNMLMLNTENEMVLNQVETQANYQGTGDDYLPQRTEYYSTTSGNAISQMQPRNQQKASLFFEQRRGRYLERDAKFGGQRRQDTLIGGINDTVSTEYGKLANVPPEEFEQRFNETVQGVDFIIQAAPLPDKLKEQVAKGAAEQAYGILKGLSEDPETAPEIVPKILKMIEEQPEEIDGGALEEAPEQPDVGPEGVQGLPGGQSGPALPRPEKLGAADLEPPQAQQTASYRILDSVAPTHSERNRIFKQGGVVVNLDTNWSKGSKPTTPMVVIPDNATQAQKTAAEAYANGMAGLYREKFGVDLKPKVVTRSANGRGRPSTIHTEPYAVTDPQAVAFFKTPEGAAAHAQILRDSFGKVPGVVFSIPHDPTRRGDHGAEANGVNEVALAKLVLADLKGGGAPRQFAEAQGLGGPGESGAPRGQNKIPAEGEPRLVSGPTPVRVADASGRFVPEQRPTYRSAKSQLRELLIRNAGTFKRKEIEAARKAEQIADQKTKEARTGTEREGLELMFANRLTKQWVDENGPLLSNEAYGKFMRAVTPITRSTDPLVYTDLLERADERPEEVISEASDAYAIGQLNQESFERIYGKAQKAMRPDTKRPPWVTEYRNMVKRSIRPEPADRTVDSMKSYGAALERFDEFIDEQKAAGKELDRKGLAAFSEQMVKEYKFGQVADKRKALSMPRFSQVSREAMTSEEVDAAVQRTIEAAKSGKLRPEELKIEAANLRKWKEALEAEAVAKGEKIPPPKPPMKLGGPKQEQGTVNKETPQSQGVPGQPGSQSGPAPSKQQSQQGESRPVGGALGVVPLAENPDGSVSLSVPGMILEPWRAFQRGWARMGQVGNVDESGRMYTASDAAKDSSEDALTASGVPLAATSFETAAKAVASSAAGDVARSLGGSFRDRWKAARLDRQFPDERSSMGAFNSPYGETWGAPEVMPANNPASRFTVDDGYHPEILGDEANINNASGYQRSVEAQTMEREGRSPFSVVPNSASMETFFDGAVKIEPGASVSQTSLYERYVIAAEAEKKSPGSFEEFKRFIAEMGIVPRRSKDGVRYDGITLFANGKAAAPPIAAIQTAKEISPQGFYSGLDEALKGFNGTDVVTADTLAKRGVKKAEIEARGLSDLLSEGKSAKVSDLQRVAGENRVEVREVQRKTARGMAADRGVDYDAISRDRRELYDTAEPVKWQSYSLDPDNPTYRETVLHLPAKGPGLDEVARKLFRKAYADLTPSQQGLILDQAGHPKYGDGQTFMSGHWSEPNVIAHARTSIQKDAQGKDVFVVNELQSDWGQKLRDGGVRDEAKIAELKKQGQAASAERQRIDEEMREFVKASGIRVQYGRYADAMTEAEMSNIPGAKALNKRWEKAASDEQRFEAEIRTAETAALGHPLVNTTDQWVNTGLRRMITQAVESGADQIAIPSGETIKAFKMGGKEDGIKYAYDQMYPKNLRNILKKIDPSIEPQVVDHLFGQKGQKLERSKGFITFKITPKLREAIKKEGQPLFSGGVPVDGEESD